jgi:hypothetical protein
LKEHKPWFDEGCSKLLNQSKQDKLQWLQISSKINGDNLNNIRCEASRHFRNKKREYMKDKRLTMNSKNIRDLYRGINEFKRGYQPRSNLVKDENGDLLAGFHNILNRWKYCFSVIECTYDTDVRQIETHTAEPLVPAHSPEDEIAIAKLKRYKLRGSGQISAQLIHAGGKEFRSDIHKFINSIWNKEELPDL